MLNTHAGQCLCGQIRFNLTGEPLASRLCWCQDCQRLASNGTVNVLVKSADLEVQGELAAYEKTADSGNMVTRRFCPSCGSHLFSNSTGRAGMTVVRVGTFNDPSAFKPTANIWASRAPAWACLDADLERFETAPPTPPAPKPAA